MPNVLYQQPGGESVFPTTGFGRPEAPMGLGDMMRQKRKKPGSGGSPMDALTGGGEGEDGDEGGVNMGDILKLLAMAGMFI